MISPLLSALILIGQGAAVPPADFPHFSVPGHEREMESLRSLFWLHYPGSGPKATLWDEWLSTPGLWPAVGSDGSMYRMRAAWVDTLSKRIIDPDGYVATHQHASIAHQLGWPFPFWLQGKGGAGWHFSFKNTIGPGWRPSKLSTTEGWQPDGLSDGGITEDGWALKVERAGATLEAPPTKIDPYQAPFIQIRWRAEGLKGAQPFLEWTTADKPVFSPDRRIRFDLARGADGAAPSIVYTMIPVHSHPGWKGEITRLRVGFGNPGASGTVVIQALFTQYDTRHTINSPNFVRGCANYFWWTRDLPFLRANIGRMRTAIRYVMTEHEALKRGVVFTKWVGHDGRSGLVLGQDGKKTILSGHGIGGNYWDLLPFGHMDAYATVHYYDAVRTMAALESEIAAHPEWGIVRGGPEFQPVELLKHAERIKREGNRLFWSAQTGRFTAGIDADGKQHDYGFTFLNLDAVHYGFATPEHAKSILAWISGARKVDGDTSQGADIYHWQFAPRATTKRNIDWYGWFWSGPETIPWGGQVQDGGAVLGFSYQDLSARLKTLGPDDAWRRLRTILDWFVTVQAAGGYRAYYKPPREGTLQGGGTAGGLGLDQEFFESVLVPQIMLNGFLGFAPTADGFRIDPRLPKEWPELTVDRIRLHDQILSVRAARGSIEVRREPGTVSETCCIHLPAGKWTIATADERGTFGPPIPVKRRARDGAIAVDWQRTGAVRFVAAPTTSSQPPGG